MNITRLLLTCAALLFGGAWGSMQARSQDSVQAPRAGERCRLCEQPLDAEDHALEHRGRRVTVCSACRPAFEADPDAALVDMQPRGALFQEGFEPTRAMRGPWFWFGVYVLAGMLCGSVAAYAAINRAQAPLPWFFAGLLGNVLALAALPVLLRRGDVSALPGGVPGGLRKVPTTRPTVVCASCGRENHPAATRCSSCGTGLTPSVVSEARRVLGGR